MQREEKEKNMKANDNNGNGIKEGNSDRQNKTIWLLSLLSPPLLSLLPLTLTPSPVSYIDLYMSSS